MSTHILLTTKSGKSILVREPQLSDLESMLTYINTLGNEDIYVNVNPADLYSLSQEEAYLKSSLMLIALNREIHLLAFDENTLIGSTTITKNDKRKKHVGVFGITLAQEYRGQGLGHQLATLTISQAWDKLSINTITLTAFADNQPALQLYRKLGFIEYGVLPEGLSYKSGYIDEVSMYLPRSKT